jgi:ArsR family transcriptional regulator, arsenate/arsenite/antimonite-responsive transcriptional repressor
MQAMPRPRLQPSGAPVKPLPRNASCTPTVTRKARPTADYAALFKALADETRLEIIGLLAAAEAPLCACDVERHFELSQPTISHHLRVLRQAEVLTCVRRGTWMYYAIAPKLSSDLRGFVALVRSAPAKAVREFRAKSAARTAA